MNLESVKEEAREIFIEFTNGMCEAMALGRKNLMSIVNDAMRLQWLSGITNSNTIATPDMVNYGYLYNWFCTQPKEGGASIAPVGWSVPMRNDWIQLIEYVGGSVSNNYPYSSTVGGLALRESGTAHWLVEDYVATDPFKFSAVGSGTRNYSGNFYSLQEEFYFLQSDIIIFPSTENLSTDDFVFCGFSNDYRLDTINTIWIRPDESSKDIGIARAKRSGLSLRLFRMASTSELLLSDGSYVGSITDVDGNIYPTVKIGSQVWTAKNWMCTKLNDGTPIPNITDNTAWSIMDDMGYCAYDNNEANARTIGSTMVYGVDSFDDSPTLAIERLRHYRGKYKNIDLSQIGILPNPSTPSGQTTYDLLRSGEQVATIGANTIVFSSPLSTDNYTVNVWIIGTDESQYDLGDITKSETGFTVSDAVIEGTLYYQVIVLV